MRNETLIFWIIGLIALGGWGALAFFSRTARTQRRRRKSYRRIVSKTNRPSVRFSVRTRKK